jgi:NAD(P)-dependent dehydrogenase (short-subunit alcohol dehydrogenase family)
MTLPTEVKSKQGYEMQFATNYLGHFYLTRLLEPLLMQSGTIDNPSRVVFLTSTTHHLYELHGEGGLAEDIPPSKEYHPLFNYALTKALTAVAAREYQKRWGSDAPVVALAVHPGIVPTGLSRENPQMSSLFFRLLFFTHKTISQAASTTIYTLLSHDVIQQVRKEGRFYFENNSVSKRNRERESLYTDEFGDDVWKLTTALLDGREEDFKEGLISSDKDLDKE